MARQALVTYTCDGTCGTTTVMDDTMFGPEDWFTVMPPDVPDWDTEEGALHFCGLDCLTIWALRPSTVDD